MGKYKKYMEGGNGNEGFMSKVRNQSTAFGASVQEGWEYIKASITGQVLSLSLSLNPLQFSPFFSINQIPYGAFELEITILMAAYFWMGPSRSIAIKICRDNFKISGSSVHESWCQNIYEKSVQTISNFLKIFMI